MPLVPPLKEMLGPPACLGTCRCSGLWAQREKTCLPGATGGLLFNKSFLSSGKHTPKEKATRQEWLKRDSGRLTGKYYGMQRVSEWVPWKLRSVCLALISSVLHLPQCSRPILLPHCSCHSYSFLLPIVFCILWSFPIYFQAPVISHSPHHSPCLVL